MQLNSTTKTNDSQALFEPGSHLFVLGLFSQPRFGCMGQVIASFRFGEDAVVYIAVLAYAITPDFVREAGFLGENGGNLF